MNLGAVYTALLTHETDHHENIKGIEHRPEARRISALEMLDKHQHLVLLGDPGGGKSTFVNFVAWCLAGEMLSHKEANLDLLTQPLPKDDEDEEERTSQSWQHGPLLPVRVILRDFVAAGLPDQEGSAVDLWNFLEKELEKAALKDFFPYLKQELMEQGGILLLDGLDEVPEARNRRSQIKHIVTDFIASFRHCRVLVTSRTYAYQKQDWRITGMQETVLAPFSKGQIRCFVEGWYTHIAGLRGINPEDAQGKAELLKRAIFSSTSLKGLAERPLLLTLMASLHSWRGGTLPEKREELYADTVELLLDWWESPKIVRDAQGDIKVMQPSLAEWLDVDREQVRRMLNEVAFKAHKNQPDLQGTADIPEKDLLSSLLSLSTNPDIKVKQLVTYISQRAGLLVPNGVGVYTFPHRTFQEYLAACYLTDYDYPDEIAKLSRTEPDRWREVALLAGAKAARGSAFGIWALADALCCHDPDDPKSDIYNTWGAHLAGQALAETAILTNVSPVNRKKLDLVRTRLCGIISGNQLTATERAIAGNTLAKLGDPRFREDAWYLPDEPMLGFVKIPGGAFLMGSDPGKEKEAQDIEQPQHSVELPGYYMARYPVTVAQFRAFVENAGYTPDSPICLRGSSNHPVVYVTWYEAIKYCKWLTETLKEWKHTPEPMAGLLRNKEWRVRLPSEVEWEKAARGTDGMLYPWGNKPNTNLANYRETGIGNTSSVGCFPDGASPYGCLDMAGNLWEWTRSLWGKEWDKPDFKYKYDPKDGREDENAGTDVLRVLRGGAFNFGYWFLRCACRDRDDPVYWINFAGFRLVFAPVTSDL